MTIFGKKYGKRYVESIIVIVIAFFTTPEFFYNSKIIVVEAFTFLHMCTLALMSCNNGDRWARSKHVQGPILQNYKSHFTSVKIYKLGKALGSQWGRLKIISQSFFLITNQMKKIFIILKITSFELFSQTGPTGSIFAFFRSHYILHSTSV